MIVVPYPTFDLKPLRRKFQIEKKKTFKLEIRILSLERRRDSGLDL